MGKCFQGARSKISYRNKRIREKIRVICRNCLMREEGRDFRQEENIKCKGKKT